MQEVIRDDSAEVTQDLGGQSMSPELMQEFEAFKAMTELVCAARGIVGGKSPKHPDMDGGLY